jgi:hypothetical protein
MPGITCVAAELSAEAAITEHMLPNAVYRSINILMSAQKNQPISSLRRLDDTAQNHFETCSTHLRLDGIEVLERVQRLPRFVPQHTYR